MIGSVTEQVRAGEPGTLVFIVHAVPSAPQQRILYEVYRDRDAYQAHQQQPYLMRFEQDRREHVLATNVIELSLQPAQGVPAARARPARARRGPAAARAQPAAVRPAADGGPAQHPARPRRGRRGRATARAAPPASLPSAGRPGLSSPGLSSPGRPGPGLAPAASVPPASANGGSGHGRPPGPPALAPRGSLASLPSLGAPLPPGGMFPRCRCPTPTARRPVARGRQVRRPGTARRRRARAAGSLRRPAAVQRAHPYDGPPPFNGGPPPYDNGQPPPARPDEPPYPDGRPYQGDRNGRPPRRGDQDGGYDGGHQNEGYQNGSGRPDRRRRPRRPGPGPGGHVITLLYRPGCHLCDDAREVIVRVAADLGVTWEEQDITQSPDDLAAYSEQIPVTLIDGVQHDFWWVSEARLRAALGA